MKSKMKLLLSCFLVLFVTTLMVSCGDDDEPKKAAIPDGDIQVDTRARVGWLQARIMRAIGAGDGAAAECR